MIYIVAKNNTLFRAFASYDDAVKYKNRKMQILHDHCCVCEQCPNISYYAEHSRRHYDYHIIHIPLNTNDVASDSDAEDSDAKDSEASDFDAKDSEASDSDTSDSNDEEFLFLIYKNRKEIEETFVTYKEAKLYKEKMEKKESESRYPNTWEINICKYSNEFLHHEGQEEIEEHEHDKYYRYKNKEIDNLF
jgi:hypothetical protein